ncbi:MAG: zf-HC2 domain-containing protein [Lachnospiraceae bacterium]|nr:zf-HC2 domain-containing protein [Lachnospiraceae bacterium]
MDCKRAENLVSAYINKDMSLNELKEFIAHVKKCSSCYDELQTYYTVYFAMEHLENGESNPSYNMNNVLLEDLKHRERYVRRVKIQRMVLAVSFALLVLLSLFALWYM